MTPNKMSVIPVPGFGFLRPESHKYIEEKFQVWWRLILKSLPILFSLTNWITSINVFVWLPLGVYKKILFHFKKCCKCYSLLMGHTYNQSKKNFLCHKIISYNMCLLPFWCSWICSTYNVYKRTKLIILPKHNYTKHNHNKFL